MQARALVYTASFRIKERRQQTFKITLCHFFISFLYLSWVLQVEGFGCPLKLNPSSVVVEYGSSVSVECSTNETHDGMGWEATVGPVPMTTTDKLITWRVSNLRRWEIKPQCYINYKRNLCSTLLLLTIYKTPDSVSISTVDHTGPMTNGTQYELQCDIVNVAPLKSLIVKWFKRETEVKTETFTDTIKTPVNVKSTLQITPNRDDVRAQYRCEAELNLGAKGPQPPPRMTSEPLNIGGLTTFWAILILVLMILVIWFTSCAVYRMCNLTQNSVYLVT
ncbi:intercellular adhesion molecule 1-like [Paramisgurnus dabryanus]|uniref:intercellular adhesion molecule 1-like n=1 Tax=Paramisgurnus dabryanus TaxID=90735 RepID=UPI0031F3F380